MTSWLRQHGLLVAAFSVGGSAVGVTDTVGPAGRPAIIAAIVAVAAIVVAGAVEIVKLRTVYCRSTACAAADRANIRQARAWGRERRRTYRKLVAMVESLQHVEAMASLVSGFETCFPPPPAGGQAAGGQAAGGERGLARGVQGGTAQRLGSVLKGDRAGRGSGPRRGYSYRCGEGHRLIVQ